MNELESEVNRIWNIAVYLQMMAAFPSWRSFPKRVRSNNQSHDILSPFCRYPEALQICF
jgi:hypothetical protein